MSVEVPEFYRPTFFQPLPLSPGQFVFGAAYLEHSHINGMTEALINAGASVKWVYDPDPVKAAAFARRFPGARLAHGLDEILQDQEVRLLAAAAVTNQRADIGIRAMQAGKHYFTDKAPLTTLDQLARAKTVAAETGKRYFVYYGEHINNEAAIHAERLLREGAIGRLVQITSMGPHLFQPERNPDWFYKAEPAGGILIDICSHQIEQFLAFSGAREADVVSSHVANHKHPEYPEFEDYGDCQFRADNGVLANCRVDWYTPAGLPVWGDGRIFLLGTEGYIELRKYINVAEDEARAVVYLVNGEGNWRIDTDKQTGFPFFSYLIKDCLEGTDLAMPQSRIWKAAELAILAQLQAKKL